MGRRGLRTPGLVGCASDNGGVAIVEQERLTCEGRRDGGVVSCVCTREGVRDGKKYDSPFPQEKSLQSVDNL